jgi:hypothetical protein
MLANPTLLSSVPPPGLTVGELAALLYNAEPRTAVLAERIRGWTKQKLLAPISGERGTGKHFRYDASAVVFEVLLLNALANTGLHIASCPYIYSVLTQLRDKLPKWQRRRERSKTIPPLFLVIQHRHIHPLFQIVSKIEIDRAADSAIVVNLAQLFGPVFSKLRV